MKNSLSCVTSCATTVDKSVDMSNSQTKFLNDNSGITRTNCQITTSTVAIGSRLAPLAESESDRDITQHAQEDDDLIFTGTSQPSQTLRLIGAMSQIKSQYNKDNISNHKNEKKKKKEKKKYFCLAIHIYCQL